MHVSQLLQVQALRRSKTFLDDHPAVAGALNTTSAKKQLDDAVARLGPVVLEQGTRSIQTRSETGRRLQLEMELRRDHMSPVAEFSRIQLTGSANFAKLTPAASKLSGERLADAALAMADAAEAYKPKFLEAQFPADFLTQLRTLAGEVKASIDSRAKQQGQRTNATQALDAAIKDGLTAVRSLNPVIRRALKKDPGLLAEWRTASRVVRKAVKTPASVPAAGAAPSPAPVPTPVATPVSGAAPSAGNTPAPSGAAGKTTSTEVKAA